MENKYAFITGAGTGIGEALSRLLASRGWTVFAGVLPGQDTASLTGFRNGKIIPVEADITSEDTVSAAVSTVSASTGGRLDLLVNNAATNGFTVAGGPLESMAIDDLVHVMNVNLFGQMRVIQKFLPLLRNSVPSRIVNVTSAAVYITIPLGASYPVSKNAFSVFSRHLRMELAPFGIDVTSLEPGGVNTPMTSNDVMTGMGFLERSPAEIRELYRPYFIHPGEALDAAFRFLTPDEFALKVYRKVLCAKKFKPVYTIGPGVGFLPVMQHVLSQSTIEKLWKRQFRVGRPGKKKN